MEPKQQNGSGSSFAPFLEGLERRRQARQTSGGDPLKLVALLQDSGPIVMTQLMAKSGMSLGEFAATIETMADTGLVSVTGQPGSEVVELTQSGSKLATIAR